MSRVTIAYARALVRAAGLALSDDGAVLSRNSRVRRLRVCSGGHVAEEDFLDLIAWIASRVEDTAALVIRFARQIGPDDLGVLGLAIKTAPTLRSSLKRIARYAPLLAEMDEYVLEESQSGASLSMRGRALPGNVHGLWIECALAGVVQTIRSAAGSSLRLQSISFRHRSGHDVCRFVRFFGCPVRFGGERDEIALSPPALDRRNPLVDAAVCDFLTRHLDDEIGTIHADTSLKAKLLGLLANALEGGIPQAADIARTLGMSERTLYRRLAKEGVTYRDVVREAQFVLARQLLADSACPIAEIASRTGFSEQSTFSRAFKRRMGHTPAHYRNHDSHA